MFLKDFFKRKLKKEEKGKEKKKIKKEEKKQKPEIRQEKKEEKPILTVKPKKGAKIASGILASPHIAEKSSILAEENQYVFKVFPKSSKTEIKKAVEELYGVRVLKVRMITIPKKKRRLGRTEGWRKGYKKAIVRIEKGQTIEIMPR